MQICMVRTMLALSVKPTIRLTYIFPAQRGVTVFTVDVSYRVKAREQQPLLCRTTADIHPENSCSLVTQKILYYSNGYSPLPDTTATLSRTGLF